MKRAFLIGMSVLVCALYMATVSSVRTSAKLPRYNAQAQQKIEVVNSGPVSFASLSVQADSQEKDQYILTFSVTNKSEKEIPALSLALRVFTPNGKLRGGAEWHELPALAPNSTRKVSLPFKIGIQASDRLVFGWGEEVSQVTEQQGEISRDKLPAKFTNAVYSLSPDYGSKTTDCSSPAAYAQGGPCNGGPLPCDPNSFCPTSQTSAQAACGGSQNNNRLASFTCNVSCSGCSYSFTCK